MNAQNQDSQETNLSGPKFLDVQYFLDVQDSISWMSKIAIFPGCPRLRSRPATDIGEHTTEILAELGLQKRINDLVGAGVIAPP